MRRDERSDTDLVLAARADDPAAFGHLFDRWFERSWNVARTILRDDDLAADVAQDALVVAWQQLDQLRNPDAFGGWLLRSTRNRALTRLARERRSTASGDEVVSGLRDRGQNDPTAAEPLPQPDAVNEIRDRQELVWAAAAALGESDASLLDLHLRHGLTPAEIAEELGVAANAAHQQLFRLRGRLGDAIGSYLLWRNGRPLCEGLAAAVSGRKAFNKSVARAVRKHQASCEQCSEERAALVDPHKLFAAAPLLVVPAGLKTQAAAALEAAGVPMAGASGGASVPDGNGTDSGAGSGNGSNAGGEANGTGADSGTGADGGSGAEADASESTADASESTADASESTASDADGADSAGGQGNGTEAGGQAGGATPTPAPSPAAPPPAPPAPVPSGGPILLSAPGRGLSARNLSRRELLVGAGAGLLTLAILFGMASLVLDSGKGMDLLAGLDSTPADEPLAAGQQGNGEQDPSGPASFSRDSARPGEPEATPTTVRSTTRASRSTTSVATSSTTPTTADTTSTTVESTTTSSSTTSTTRDTTTSSSSTTSTTRDTTTSSSSTSEVTRPPAPTISLSVTRVSSSDCPNALPYAASWSTTNATSATLAWPSGSASVATSGSRVVCVLPGQAAVVTLTASGPGGTVSDQASG